MIKKSPLIELTIDKMDETKPTDCIPYVWIVRIRDREGCAIDVDFYKAGEVSEKLNDFLGEIPTSIFRTIFEGVSCRLNDIGREEAVDAILMAFSRYFEEDDESLSVVDASQFKILRDVDFLITTAWNGETISFTLLTNGQLSYSNHKKLLSNRE